MIVGKYRKDLFIIEENGVFYFVCPLIYLKLKIAGKGKRAVGTRDSETKLQE